METCSVSGIWRLPCGKKQRMSLTNGIGFRRIDSNYGNYNTGRFRL
jgi:hypothetical protein